MRQIRREYIDRFTDGINAISEDARARLADALASIDWTLDVAQVREAVVNVMQAYCSEATDVVAMLAAEFYDGLRAIEVGERMGALALSGRDPAATEGAVRAFAQLLVEGKREAFVARCSERLDYECKVAAAQACMENARRDRHKPKFARVPAGGETCDFCLMLASRGFVYASEQSASHAHANCDCRVVPSWKAMGVQGYDPDALRDQWRATVDAKAEERAERNGTDVDAERRAIYRSYAQSARNARKRRN